MEVKASQSQNTPSTIYFNCDPFSKVTLLKEEQLLKILLKLPLVYLIKLFQVDGMCKLLDSYSMVYCFLYCLFVSYGFS